MSFLDGLLGVVGAVGDVLDTPAAMLRSGLMGENPLTAALDTGKRHSMRDVLEYHNVLGENTPGLDAGDVLAGALGMVADPMNLIPGLGIAKNLSRARAVKLSDSLGSTPGFIDDTIKSVYGRSAGRFSPSDQEAPIRQWMKSLSPDETTAIREWSGPNSRSIQRVLRHPNDKMTAAVAKDFGVTPRYLTQQKQGYADSINEALSRYQVPDDTLVYRVPGLTGTDGLRVGGTFKDKGFFATSISPNESTGWYGATIDPDSPLFDVIVPQGHNAGFLGMSKKLSSADKERELLLPSGGSYRVLGRRDLPIVGAHHPNETPSFWFRGDSADDVDPLFMGEGEYSFATSTQPNYLLEALGGNNPRRFNPQPTETLLAALLAHQAARSGASLNDFTPDSRFPAMAQ